ncbi:site-specific integrase [Lysinibacillus sp. NPDC096418]|uniref:site-specific integrase n=1 Tax=Lysinibacillus sp. NPDC096418 TaxID=3364138 RepID=UPI00381332E9
MGFICTDNNYCLIRYLEVLYKQLRAAIDEFVLNIEIEKNYSDNTVLSYEYDLQLFLAF